MTTTALSFRGRGYTVLELLAVIVIMALAAGFMLPSLASADDSAQCKAIAAKLRDLDHKARLLARSEGRVDLMFDDDRRAFILREHDSSQQLMSVAVERDATLELTTDSTDQIVVFDRTGRSADYAFAVTSGAHRAAFRVTGATGLLTEGVP